MRALCARTRAAGAPKAAPRPRLVEEYRRLAVALGAEVVEVSTGHELARASAALLRATHPPAPRPAAA